MREEILQSFQEKLKGHPNLNKVYENIDDHAHEILNTDYTAVIYNVGNGKIELKLAEINRLPDGAALEHYRFGKDSLITAVERVITEEQAYITRAREVVAKPEYLQTALLAPLFSEGECVGVLVLGRNDPKRGFRSGDIELGRFLSDELVLAVEEQILAPGLMERRSEQAKQDKKMVLTLQEILLPPANPRVPELRISTLYQTAREEFRLGGDFYDVIQLPHQENTVLVMGDVVGHGLEAAKITALVKYTLRAFAYEGNSPSEMIRRANHVITPQIGENELVTLLVGVYNASDKTLTYASAGHYFPIIVSKTRGAYRPLERLCSPPLGIIGEDAQHYREISTSFQEGDTLLLYTDGVVEARSLDGTDLYGQDNLFSLVSKYAAETPSVITKEIMRDVYKFSGEKLRDDAAIMAVKHKKPPTDKPGQDTLGYVRDHISLPAHSERLNAARDFVINLAEAVGFSEDDVFSIRLAVGEALINALEHGSENSSTVDIIATWENQKKNLNIQIRDRGRDSDSPPQRTSAPEAEDVHIGDEDISTRGRGLMLMENCMDSCEMKQTKHGMLVSLNKQLVE